MCCLPNKFPLPIFLIVNKSLKIEDDDLSFGMDNVKEICENNLFFKSFIIQPVSSDGASSNIEDMVEIPSKLSTYIEKTETPFREMIELILKFKDLRNSILQSMLKKKNLKTQGKNQDDIEEGIRSHDKKSCVLL